MNINLGEQIETQLPAELVHFMQLAGEVTARQGNSLYLVGGVVRDLLLGKPTFDLDLVVEGDAIELARQLAQMKQAKVVTHGHFNTANLQWGEWSVDLATARSETYARPGALPEVKPSSIKNDLFRRDFTVNAMAVHLSPGRYGELIDLYGGREDLEHRLIRILHEKSFSDDATRIWRALRYEQRLDFELEATTLELLQRDIDMLDTISADRIRHELELVLKETHPEKALRRAGELGVLHKLHPALEGNGWLAEKIEQARRLSLPRSPSVGLYLSLFAHQLAGEQVEQLIVSLKSPKLQAQTLRDTINLKNKLRPLANPELKRSSVYRLLHSYSVPAITANLIASDSPIAEQHIRLFLNRLRYIKPALSGDDLKRLGIAPGLQMKVVLDRLHEARLDGKVTTKRGEEEMVRGWVANHIQS
ncbi:CCA tRNA nucleotidyltransferase [Chloroflexota bacterium]